ncbi:8-oxo-dGTP diphosphatase [Hathewaya proteolytica DSM 3090]|uniref:8-oxo-dGTP diphosphatase n=1 Tax=Hathewaya proteolytica DSM 3090 TaxID=1121331 RepID=A0A1M6QLJ8_9CLOT|nr:(deoxy)nucleoside triphosphate pyrophosphohydrolase [Hathewaya proteolytica]SHK20933.1 8-oxo-dGTP diphosphatase [Hathewaya proteolytica DSM 3090]
MKKTIQVVGAILENQNNEILCALRSPSMSMGNLWEFPGGKVEKYEDLKEAIVREIKEELNCDIKALEIFNHNVHEYENIIVNLITVRCELINDSHPIKSEHAALIWLKRPCLCSLKWAPADIPAMEALAKEL